LDGHDRGIGACISEILNPRGPRKGGREKKGGFCGESVDDTKIGRDDTRFKRQLGLKLRVAVLGLAWSERKL
jgi:hypothetical protein